MHKKHFMCTYILLYTITILIVETMKIRIRRIGYIIVALACIKFNLGIFLSRTTTKKHATFRNEKYATKNIPFGLLYQNGQFR